MPQTHTKKEYGLLQITAKMQITIKTVHNSFTSLYVNIR
jgi:hypothetical protein